MTDWNWWRVKATLVQMFHLTAASLQCCHQDVAQKLHMSPVCPCQAGSELTWVGKMAQLGLRAFPPRYIYSTSPSAPMPFHPSAGLSWCTAPTSSCSVVAVFSPLQSQHPKSQHLQLMTTICTRACIIINKQRDQATAQICPSTGHYQAINSLTQRISDTINRWPGNSFWGPFPPLMSHLVAGWAHIKHSPPLLSITTDLLRRFVFILLLYMQQTRQGWKGRGKPYTAESCAVLSFVFPCLEIHKRKIKSLQVLNLQSRSSSWAWEETVTLMMDVLLWWWLLFVRNTCCPLPPTHLWKQEVHNAPKINLGR